MSGHPDPEIRGNPVSEKIFRASVWFRNKWGGGGGGGGAGSVGP